MSARSIVIPCIMHLLLWTRHVMSEWHKEKEQGMDYARCFKGGNKCTLERVLADRETRSTQIAFRRHFRKAPAVAVKQKSSFSTSTLSTPFLSHGAQYLLVLRKAFTWWCMLYFIIILRHEQSYSDMSTLVAVILLHNLSSKRSCQGTRHWAFVQ